MGFHRRTVTDGLLEYFAGPSLLAVNSKLGASVFVGTLAILSGINFWRALRRVRARREPC
jgi:hypothetical protein